MVRCVAPLTDLSGSPNADTVFPRSPPSLHREATVPAPSRGPRPAHPPPARPQRPKGARERAADCLQSKHLEPNANARKQCDVNRKLPGAARQGSCARTLLPLRAEPLPAAGGRKGEGARGEEGSPTAPRTGALSNCGKGSGELKKPRVPTRRQWQPAPGPSPPARAPLG